MRLVQRSALCALLGTASTAAATHGSSRLLQAEAWDCHANDDANTTFGMTSSSNCQFQADSLVLTGQSVSHIRLTVPQAEQPQISCRKNRHARTSAQEWYGSCDGEARDANFVSRVIDETDGTEAVYGSIHISGDICKIFPDADGNSRIACTPETAFAPEEHVDVVLDEEHVHRLNRTKQRQLFGYQPSAAKRTTTMTTSALRGAPSSINSINSTGFTTAAHRQLYDDLGSTIDIMVVWTKEAECHLSTSSTACTSTDFSVTTETNMRGLIDLAVMETNTAFSLSGIATRLRLVHAYRDATYIETNGTAGYSAALRYITYDDDDSNTGIHAKRSLYGADMVAMIVANPDLCGLAWSAYPRPEYMFSVTNYDCATGYYTFGHEIGHTFGCNHDRGQTGTCGQANSYNYGYRDPNAAFRTILAYDCKVGQCDNMPKNRCSKVQRFSNPTHLYDGNKAVGSATADNARVINERRALVASFYPSMNCDAHDDCNDNDASTADTCQFPTAVCVFTPIPPTAAPTKRPTTPRPITPQPITAAPTTRLPTTRSPTMTPSRAPTTRAPTTRAPTKAPTIAPKLMYTTTKSPTNAPISSPINAPSKSPINQSTKSPTTATTAAPMTLSTTRLPTNVPNLLTVAPTPRPTAVVAPKPNISNAPTKAPTTATNSPVQKQPLARIPPIAPTSTKAPMVPIPPPTRAPTKPRTRPLCNLFKQSPLCALRPVPPPRRPTSQRPKLRLKRNDNP